ncbi:MAG: hypothetical protein IPK52_12590 [Chloroflexi bacterium]|nr:hypothetical protein [Chloroflexota bacterium]
MRRLFAVVIWLALLLPAAAQDAPVPIAPENAAALQMLGRVGSALPMSIVYSPDGRYLLASTTDATYAYALDRLDAAPKVFPFTRVTFDAGGFLVGAGQRWNLDTGLSVGTAPALRILRGEERQTAIIEVVKPGGETIRVQTGIREPIARTAVSSDYSRLAVAVAFPVVGENQPLRQPTVYLFALPSGDLIAALPQKGNGDSVSQLFFTMTDGYSVLVVETLTGSHISHGALGLYRASTGELLDGFSGTIPQPMVHNASGAFAVLLRTRMIVYGTGSAIGTFESALDPNDTPTLAVSASGFFLVNDFDEKLSLLPFGADGQPGEIVTVPFDGPMLSFPRFVGRHVVYGASGSFFAWDPAAPAGGPREILSGQLSGSRGFNPDFTRYLAPLDADRQALHDAATGGVLMELPKTAVFSPDWSSLAYWDNGSLVVHDLNTEQVTTLDILSGYLGRVADVMSGSAVFTGAALRVVDLDPASGPGIEPLTLDGIHTGAMLFNGGLCLATFAPAEGGMNRLTLHGLNSEAACGPAEYLTNLTPESSVVTPFGTYLAGFSTYCDSPYAYPSANIYPLRGQPAGELPIILHIEFGCERSTFAFTPDEATIYYTDGMLRRSPFSAAEGETELSETLLGYYDPASGAERFASGVFLSPDEKHIAVQVSDTGGTETVQSRMIEVFALRDLREGVLRRDVRPQRTIPGATFAAFSPDGEFVVTDTGLYALESAAETLAVRGTVSAFSPDSALLASYQDGYLTLWGMPEPDALNFPLAQYAVGGVQRLAFSADGTRLYVIRAGEVQIWGVSE